MKFILHEIKLWFNDNKNTTKSYKFLPNKINIITGDATTGKTSFWSIIDYCLLSGKINLVNTIIENVSWFGIRISLNDKEISLIRKSPRNGTVSADLYFNYKIFPDIPTPNSDIAEIKSILDKEFGITDDLRFPLGKDLGETNFNLSYRYFLLFNSLTEDIIGHSNNYFDTAFYGRDEYNKALNHIFDLVIGVNDMNNIKALERLKKIKSELKKIKTQQNKNIRNQTNFENDILDLIHKCKINNLIEHSDEFKDTEEALLKLNTIISTNYKIAKNNSLLSGIDELELQKDKLRNQLFSIEKYKKEYSLYKQNLKNTADSLQPIDFLKSKLSEQLIDSYQSNVFIDSLSKSLEKIKQNLSKEKSEPIMVKDNSSQIIEELKKTEFKLKKLKEIKNNQSTDFNRFIFIGKLQTELEYLQKNNIQQPIDSILLNSLNGEKEEINKIPKETKEILYIMINQLNKSIQRNYNQLKSLPSYKNYQTRFDKNDMLLKLYPPTDQLEFPIDNVGSKSNYMFMHLCLFLGLHEHMINIEHKHVPQFLFIDQPSIPYFTGAENKNNDDKKLIDAFTLLNSFIDYITFEKNNTFQIFMVEHASKDYWEKNNLTNFHLVDEFIDGKGLIPKIVYNS